MSCNLARISDRFKQYDDEGRWPTIWRLQQFRIILHRASFSTDPSIETNHERAQTMIRAYPWGQEFLWSWMWSTIISIRPSMVPFQKYSTIIITGWSQMVASNGTSVGMKQLMWAWNVPPVWLIPSRIGSKVPDRWFPLVWWVTMM